MDEKLKNALEFSNYVIVLNNHKRVLFEKYKNDSIFYYNSGKFSVTQQLISFCKTLCDLSQESVVLLDDDGLPVKILNINEFTTTIINQYTLATSNYLFEYNKLIKNRSVAGIVDL
jgi:hypothetical protein